MDSNLTKYGSSKNVGWLDFLLFSIEFDLFYVFDVVFNIAFKITLLSLTSLTLKTHKIITLCTSEVKNYQTIPAMV